MTSFRRGLPLGFLIGAILSIIFMGGYAAGAVITRSSLGPGMSTSDKDLNDFLTAYHLVTQRSYFRPFNKHQLIYAAIDGMLGATGDPHTLFLSPRENQVAAAELNGAQFSGIGAIVVPANGVLQIVAPLPHTPASRAGIEAGDRVTKIDGRLVSSMSGDTAVARIHGPTGTIVKLTLVRGKGKPFTVGVKRAQIPPTTAFGRALGHHLGEIQIMSFGDTTGEQVREALNILMHEHIHGLILDLRENPGGYVDAAQRVVSDFISRGVVAYERDPTKVLHPLPVLESNHVVTIPMVVLVDAGTASAAEITAGALHDYGRAYLIGTRTYGKGSMQSVYSLSDGSSIRITDRLWLTPHRHSIQKIGIQPDEVVTEASAGPGKRDPQLEAAVRYLLAHGAR